MSSLRRRLGRVLPVLLAGFAAQWFIADRMIVEVGESEMVTRLQHDGDSLSAALAIDPQGTLRVDPQRAGLIYGRPYSGHYFVVQAGAARVASASFGEARPFPARAAGDGRESVAHLDGPRGQPLLVLQRTVEVGGGHRVELAVAEDLTELRAQLRLFRLLFLGASVAVLLAALALQLREIGLALRPLEAVRQAIQQLPVAGIRPMPADVPAEILPLVQEIERLMDLVQRRLQQSRTAIGNLSHSLKTPLAGLMRLLDDPRLAPHPQLQRQLREQLEAIRAPLERELKRARLAGDRRGGGGFDADAEMPALVELLTRIHADKPLSVRWQGPGHVLAFDREDLLELIGNLADNACKWAAGRVSIEIRDAGGLSIVVADDGPGCPPERLDSLGSRGQRADESKPGHGLGLAIVRDIVAAAGGQLAFGRSAALGGLEVRARFPG